MTLINAEFHSIWDGKFDVDTPCTVDLHTGVLAIEVSDDHTNLEHLEREFVQLPHSHVEHAVEERDGDFYLIDLPSFTAEAVHGLVG